MQDVRLRLWRSTTASCRDAMLAPPKGVALGNGRAGVSDIGRFPGAVALLNACGLIRRTTCIVDPRNTLLPQCKIVRDKQQTERHQVLSDRAKNYFRYSRAYRRTASSSLWMTTKAVSLGLKCGRTQSDERVISCIYIKLYEFCRDAFYERFIGPE